MNRCGRAKFRRGPLPHVEGWSADRIRVLITQYRDSLNPAARDKRPGYGKLPALGQMSSRIMEKLMAECTNLCDTVIKSRYPGVGEDMYEVLHALAMEKCFEMVSRYHNKLLEMDSVGSRMYTSLRNTLNGFWRDEHVRKLRNETWGEVAAVVPRRTLDPVQACVAAEFGESLETCVLRRALDFRFNRRFGPLYRELVRFYFEHRRIPLEAELGTYDKLEADRVVYNAAVYHFNRSWQEATQTHGSP